MSLSDRIYGLLLRAYPGDFRDEYGAEMRRFFSERRRDNPVAAWAGAIADVLWNAPGEHVSLCVQDAGYALRSWRRTLSLPLVCLTVLAFGIGASTAIFSAVDALVLDPVPGTTEPDRLVRIHQTNPTRDLVTSASVPNYLSWKRSVPEIEFAAFSGQDLIWTNDNVTERWVARAATASFLPVLGASVVRGRWFGEDEEVEGRHRVAVFSDRLWRSRFGSDPNVIGRTVTLNGAPYQVVGIASPSFGFPEEPDLWVPKVIDPKEGRGINYIAVIGRLHPGVALAEAQSKMTAVSAALAEQFPATNAAWSVHVVLLAETMVAPEVRKPLWILLGAVGSVWLIACFNVANLLLVRAAARRPEMAIRAALGAGAGRLSRQLLTEAAMLASAGGLGGVLLAGGIVALARFELAGLVPRAETIALNGT